VKHLMNMFLMSVLGAVCGLAVGHGEELIVMAICSALGVLFMLCIYLLFALSVFLHRCAGSRTMPGTDLWDRSHRMFRIERPFMRDGKPW
jgi:hypothetical protein